VRCCRRRAWPIPSGHPTLGRPRLSGDYIVGHVTSMLSPGTIVACASAGTPSGEA
jgi:hypothetical protein